MILLEILLDAVWLSAAMIFLILQAILSAAIDFFIATFQVLFSNWIAQVIFGGWVAFEFQRRQNLAIAKLSRTEKKHENMRQIQADIFVLTDTRLHTSQTYLDALVEGNKVDIANARATYSEAVFNMNVLGHKRLTDALQYYPARLVFEVEHELLNRFSGIERDLKWLRIHNNKRSEEFRNKCKIIYNELKKLKEKRSIYSNAFLGRIEQSKNTTGSIMKANASFSTLELLKLAFGIGLK